MKTLSQKFNSLVNGTQFVTGTSNSERISIMSGIIEKNKDGLVIEINNISIYLSSEWSVSGKTVTYVSPLTKDEYLSITGSEFGLKKNPSISIQMDGKILVNGGGKYNFIVPNSNVKLNTTVVL